MPELVIRPLQWSALPSLAEAPPLDDADLACLDDVRSVLMRHGKLKRFAVHLAHGHFDLAPGEVLIEWPDPDGRTQHVTAGRLEDVPAARPTTWIFDEGPEMRLSDKVYCVCVSNPNAMGACAHHGRSASPSKARIDADRAELERINRERAEVENKPVAGHDRARSRRPGKDD